MLQQATDVVARGIRQSCITVAGKEWLLTLPQRLVTVHSRTVIAIQWLRHKRRRLPKLVCSIANYILKYLKIICRSQQRRIAKIDLTLSGSGNFVVMTFDIDATFGQRKRDLRSQINQRINRRARHIAFLRTNAIAEIRSGKLVRITTAVPV